MPIVIIHWAPGRSEDQKKRIFRKITDTIVEDGGAAREAVTIIFQDIVPGDSARGGEVLGAPNLDDSEGDK